MTAQIVEIAGQKIAMLPIEDYRRLIDIAEDKADMLAAIEAERRRDANEEYVPVEVIDHIMAGDSPLRAWRKYRDITLEELGIRVGHSHAYLSTVERGKKAGTLALWRKLADELNVAIEDIAPES
jgi:DNA-binding XRE family transcriptional regulator